jgi:hypothetical protein
MSIFDKADAAIKNGLKPLADLIWQQKSTDKSLEALANEYLTQDDHLSSANKVLDGMRSILIARILTDDALSIDLAKQYYRYGVYRGHQVVADENLKAEYKNLSLFALPIGQIEPSLFDTIQNAVRDKQVFAFLSVDDLLLVNWLMERLIHTDDTAIRFQLGSIVADVYFGDLKDVSQRRAWQQLKQKMILGYKTPRKPVHKAKPAKFTKPHKTSKPARKPQKKLGTLGDKFSELFK